jgi:hypothetical protein
MLKIKIVKKGSTTAKSAPAACPWVIEFPPEAPRS